MMKVRSLRRSAFTLVEVLIVVIILGILAAVVIPQFSDATTDAKKSALTTNLQTIRGQLELYRLQHNSAYPTLANLTTAMTAKTNADGTTTGTPQLGPYLQSIPVNPYNNLATVGNATAATNTTGWRYDETNGKFTANDSVANQAL